MDEVNGSSAKKPVLFSIGSYREKKKINKLTAAELFTASNSQTAPSPLSPTINRSHIMKERPVSLDITDAPLFNSLQHQPSRKLTFQNGKIVSPTCWKNSSVDKPTCPPTLDGDNQCPVKGQQNEAVDKPARPSQLYTRSISLEPEQLRNSGKVALTIAAYEGEPKTPTRLNFLPPQTRLSRSSSKASDVSTPGDDSISSRLQDELVATLKRSNLKKRHDTLTNGIINETKADAEPKADDESKTNNDDDDNDKTTTEKANGEITNGNVRKLATELTKALAFRSKPEEEEE